MSPNKSIILSSPPTKNVNSLSGPRELIPPLPYSATLKDITRPPLLTILLRLYITYFIFKTSLSIVNILNLVSTSRANHLLGRLFENNPALCFYPVFLAIIAAYLLYLLVRTSIYTYHSFKLLLISVIAIPILYSAYRSVLIPSFFTTISTIFNEITLFSLIIITALYLLPQTFTRYSKSLSIGQVSLFTFFASLILFPTFAFTYYLIESSLNPNTNKAAIEKMVSNRLYFPSALPQGLTTGSQFYISDTKDISLIEPTAKITFTNHNLTIILSQTKVAADFDLTAYISTQQISTPASAIILPQAINQLGYLKVGEISKDSTISLRSLYFVTPTHTLVSLISPNSEVFVDTLVKIAQSLR